MELFIGSFVIFVMTALALGIGVIFRGRPMAAGCRRLPGESRCESEMQCGGVCRRRD